MKIALVSPYDWAVPGGVNTHIANLSRHLRAAGHETTVFAPSSGPVPPGECVPMGRTLPFRASGSVQRIGIGVTSSRVRRVLAGGQFDIVHAHEPLMPTLPYHFLRHSRAVNVGTFHAAKEGGNRLYRYTRPVTSRWYRRLHGRIAVSVAAERLIGRYFPGPYTIIPNGIDYGRFAAPRPRLPEFDDGRINILFVGRPEKRKGLDYLVEAFRVLRQRHPDQLRLIVVGAGDFSRYREMTAAMDDVTIVGEVGNDVLPAYHWSADIYCSPATGNESQGIAVLEAMAARRAVVASNIEGFATMVTDGGNGRLVEPRSASAIVAAMTPLIASSVLREELATRAQERARTYDWGDVSLQVMSLYEHLLAERQQRAERTGDDDAAA